MITQYLIILEILENMPRNSHNQDMGPLIFIRVFRQELE